MQTPAPVAGGSLRLNSWQSPLQSSVDSRLWCKDFEAVLYNTILWAEVHRYRPRDRGVGGGRQWRQGQGRWVEDGRMVGGWVLPAHSTHCKSNCTLTVLKTTTMTVTMARKCHLFLSLSWLFLTIWLMQYSLSWFSSVRRRSKVTKVEFSSIPSWINLPPACTRVVCEGGSGGEICSLQLPPHHWKELRYWPMTSLSQGRIRGHPTPLCLQDGPRNTVA